MYINLINFDLRPIVNLLYLSGKSGIIIPSFLRNFTNQKTHQLVPNELQTISHGKISFFNFKNMCYN